MTPIIFIAGATGTQGTALVKALTSSTSPPTIHALARDTSSPQSQAIAALGVKLFQGSYQDTSVVTAALQGATSAFLNLSRGVNDADYEINEAKSLLVAFKAAGIKHIVYSSAMAANDPTKLFRYRQDSFVGSLMRSKQAIENEVRNAGFDTWTILRPGNFMSNHLKPLPFVFPGLVETGVWSTAYTKDTRIPMIDPATIGAFAAAALLDPQRFHKDEIPLSDEFLTVDALLGTLSRVSGRPLTATFMSDDEIESKLPTMPVLEAQINMRNMYIYVDMDKLKTYGIKLSSFDSFIDGHASHIKTVYAKQQ